MAKAARMQSIRLFSCFTTQSCCQSAHEGSDAVSMNRRAACAETLFKALYVKQRAHTPLGSVQAGHLYFTTTVTFVKVCSPGFGRFQQICCKITRRRLGCVNG